MEPKKSSFLEAMGPLSPLTHPSIPSGSITQSSTINAPKRSIDSDQEPSCSDGRRHFQNSSGNTVDYPIDHLSKVTLKHEPSELAD
ncbi:MAG: hypothetical protein M2R45_03744 [Verrucomicrobia subdivision 3 bacterium]|nr:hypothetical protein [Limisphaerales bacterium]MCS1416933.1 hypothetical protein [Limisphaerales bacterium]